MTTRWTILLYASGFTAASTAYMLISDSIVRFSVALAIGYTWGVTDMALRLHTVESAVSDEKRST